MKVAFATILIFVLWLITTTPYWKPPTVSLTPFGKGIFIVVMKEPMKINYTQHSYLHFFMHPLIGISYTQLKYIG